MRKCPQCRSKDIKKVKKIGLCAFNIWNDFICSSCGYIWGEYSTVDKFALKYEEKDNYK